MKKYLTEFDELQAALRHVPLDENVMPYYGGRLVENEDAYNKIQKLLDCPQMAEAQKYLYNLDVEDLQEDEIEKVNALFDLGVKRGYIDNSFQEELDKEENPTAVVAAEEPGECCCGPDCACGKAPIPCWTVLYSATKGGDVKSGECYSNAISVQAAKADCLAKLARFGYENVSILAIEAGDPDSCDSCPECGEQLDEAASKNPYAAGMKTVGATTTAAKPKKAKTVKEDDEDAGSDDAEDAGSDDAEDAGSDDAEDAGSDDAEDAGSDDAEDAGSEDTGSDDAEDEGGDDDFEDAGDDAGDDDAEGDDAEGDDAEGDDAEGDGSEGEDTGDDAEGDDAGDDEEELDDEKKSEYKNEYKRIFRETMLACKFDGKCFNDLTIAQKVAFFTMLSDKWKKAEPSKFMTDKEQDQLESIVAED